MFIKNLVRPLYTLVHSTLNGYSDLEECMFFDGSIDYKTITVVELDELLSTGIDVNSKDISSRTALMYFASSSPDPRIIKRMVVAGAMINEVDDYGVSALMMAARYNKNHLIVKELIKSGAQIDQISNLKRTALMYAAIYNENPRVINTLLKCGADGSLRDLKNYTAFDHLKRSSNATLRKTPALRLLKEAAQ